MKNERNEFLGVSLHELLTPIDLYERLAKVQKRLFNQKSEREEYLQSLRMKRIV